MDDFLATEVCTNLFQYGKPRLKIIWILGMPKMSALYTGNTTVLRFFPAMPLHDGCLNIEIGTWLLSKFIFPYFVFWVISRRLSF